MFLKATCAKLAPMWRITI